eukprot:GHUV01052290.1.p1 GENE.GHUV01052290.1~~GHUV01052290.1.p1  ORF type:complete len:101 (+),score=14.06 GHUV01052290.1:185-487(+)
MLPIFSFGALFCLASGPSCDLMMSFSLLCARKAYSRVQNQHWQWAAALLKAVVVIWQSAAVTLRTIRDWCQVPWSTYLSHIRSKGCPNTTQVIGLVTGVR